MNIINVKYINASIRFKIFVFTFLPKIAKKYSQKLIIESKLLRQANFCFYQKKKKEKKVLKQIKRLYFNYSILKQFFNMLADFCNSGAIILNFKAELRHCLYFCFALYSIFNALHATLDMSNIHNFQENSNFQISSNFHLKNIYVS